MLGVVTRSLSSPQRKFVVALVAILGIAAVGASLVSALRMDTGAGSEEESRPGAEQRHPNSNTSTEGKSLSLGVYADACDRRETIEADVDGDGVADLVYHEYVHGSPTLGVCTGDGGTDKIAGSGQTELLSIIDIEGDGRDEMFFGGTTMGGQVFDVGVFRNGLKAVELENPYPLVSKRRGDRLVVWNGEELMFGRRQVRAGLAFGCEDVDGDGVKELTQVVVDRRGHEFHWVRRAYAIEGSSAILVSRRAGTENAEDGASLVETAKDMISMC